MLVKMLLPSVFITLLFLVGCGGQSLYLTGAYQFEDREVMTISPSEGKTYRYRNLYTGASQRLYPAKDQTFVSGEGWANDSPVTLEVTFEVDESKHVTGLQWKSTQQTVQYAKKLYLREEYTKFPKLCPQAD